MWINLNDTFVHMDRIVSMRFDDENEEICFLVSGLDYFTVRATREQYEKIWGLLSSKCESLKL